MCHNFNIFSIIEKERVWNLCFKWDYFTLSQNINWINAYVEPLQNDIYYGLISN